MEPGSFCYLGVKYCWQRSVAGYNLYWVSRTNPESIQPGSVPHGAVAEATKALLALQDAEENWIEFKSDREPDTAGMIRISRDGRQGQEWTGYEWVEYDAWWLKAVYRAGLEVGRENTLRELGEASDE